MEKKFSRYKHWFQPNDPFRYPHDTLVIAEFRNPYDWLMAMHHVPHHSPAHAGVDWKTFLTKTWTTKRIGLDLKLKGDEMCQHHFQYRDLISCIHKPEPWVPVDNRTSLDKPFYEMRNDGSGEPYDNIMEMRSDKIRNTLEIKDFEGVADLWMIQYEYMLSHGTKELLDRITEWTGVKPKCKPYPPQDRRVREVPEDFIQFITDHLNWTAEAHIGYEPIRPIRPVSERENVGSTEEEEYDESEDGDDDDNDEVSSDDKKTESATKKATSKTSSTTNTERKTSVTSDKAKIKSTSSSTSSGSSGSNAKKTASSSSTSTTKDTGSKRKTEKQKD
mgnify:CR=1 FL=1